MPKINPGDRVPSRILTTIKSEQAHIPDPNHLVHLQLRRYAGCPMCNMHVRSIAVRHEEITAAGVREVVVFHSTAQEMLLCTAVTENGKNRLRILYLTRHDA